jgi:SAM-dependent methyltransferase
MYYADKLEILRDIFGSKELSLGIRGLTVHGHTYPIVNDVIILLDPEQYPTSLRRRLGLVCRKEDNKRLEFAEDIQFTFGEEWKNYPKILPEHEQEFRQYFDLVNLSELLNATVCDLGCGIGRWSYFLKNRCRFLVLVDFSEAIFVARENLKDATNAIFFMADLKYLPFRNDFAKFLFCLGVLHHLPSDALEEVRRLGKYSPRLLIYLYYALDNRAGHFRYLLRMATWLRLVVSKIRNSLFRAIFTMIATYFLYLPFIILGKTLRPLGLSSYVPLYEGYSDKSLRRIRQDVYDRFFTRIEQRFSKNQIMSCKDTFNTIIISDQLPYWHFICQR